MSVTMSAKAAKRQSHAIERRQTGSSTAAKHARPLVEAIMSAAKESNFLDEKTGRIGVRISPALLEQAKKMTGIQSDTDLIEFALANLALEDNFADVFKKSRGTVDPDLKLGY